jgi:hypothetical protein
MYSKLQAEENSKAFVAVNADEGMPAVEKSRQIHARTLTAIQVGRGSMRPPKLAREPKPKKSRAPKKAVA